MKAIWTGVAVIAVLAGTAAGAQQPVASPDPARLQAARALVDAAMPPEMRDSLMRGMIAPMMENVRSALSSSPQMAELVAKQPQAGEVLDRFFQRTVDSTMTQLQAAMPKLIDAMSQSYARHLTLVQLKETRDFYATPTGRALVASQPAVATDPAVLQVQREMMTSALARMPEQMKQLQAEMAGLEKPKG